MPSQSGPWRNFRAPPRMRQLSRHNLTSSLSKAEACPLQIGTRSRRGAELESKISQGSEFLLRAFGARFHSSPAHCESFFSALPRAHLAVTRDCRATRRAAAPQQSFSILWIKWGASVARCSPNRAYLLGSEGHFVIVGTCTISPITADTIPSERSAFTRPSILFRPRRNDLVNRSGGGAGYRPRVRSAYYASVYRHSPGEPEQV